MALSRNFSSFSRLRSVFSSSRNSQLRCITTSKKNQETAVIDSQETADKVCDTANKNWVSYGFSVDDKEEDRTALHAVLFFGFSLTLVGGGFLLAYKPEQLGTDWQQREAFLELRRREKLGLPLVDPNYIDVHKIKIPSDEELGDTEIII